MKTQPAMHQILLRPTDVLFFRDGRPMSGSLAGHTVAWPLPDMVNHALHAALHRAELEGVHNHRRSRNGQYSNEAVHRDRKFGSVQTVGPFPVDAEGNWFFPRPKDAQTGGNVEVTHLSVKSLSSSQDDLWLHSSLPDPLEYALGSKLPPQKHASPEPWISTKAFEAYLKARPLPQGKSLLKDDDVADREQQIGIAIDPETGTTGQGQAKGKIYSAHYLRLREGFRLGLLSEALDKGAEPGHRRDLLAELFRDDPVSIVVGGQQRICSATRVSLSGVVPHLPRGLSRREEFIQLRDGSYALKWILLSPAIWPEISEGKSVRGTERNAHPGGWLPGWVDKHSGQVLLRLVSENERRRRRSLNAGSAGYGSAENAERVQGRLVAALVPKPIVVTGWALPNGDNAVGGAKPVHLAVSAGAVYYFETPEPEKLASVLNWHGVTDGMRIKNRRSTLFGEKGYGIGVCGTWSFYDGACAANQS